jgi:alanine-glyoxylate transaminase/serine-glyoxylate transaminase/serine-pyruvate transaminase
VLLDCVTSLGGVAVQLDAWGIDAAYAGTQKCLSAPPGLAPASFGERALARVRARTTRVPSWYFDVSLLAGYYGSERVYHHTAPVSMIYALAEALRVVEEEGLEARAARHRRAAQALLEAVLPLGFRPLVAEPHRLPPLTTLWLPERLRGPAEAALRRRLLDAHGIEVGGGLGKLAGEIWRIGLMGENAREESVARLAGALREELRPGSAAGA